MKVLMFGWELPPELTGGLGTACKGILEGFQHLEDVEIIFVVPSAVPDKQEKNITFIDAQKNKVIKSTYFDKRTKLPLQFIKINSSLRPYQQPKPSNIKVEYFQSENQQATLSTPIKTVSVKGGYGDDLYDEVYHYAELAQKVAESEEFDVIHAHDWMTYQAGLAAKKISGKPLVVHVHSTDYDRSIKNRNKGVCDIEQWAYHEADAVVTVSNSTKKSIAKNYAVPEEKITTVHNAVELHTQQIPLAYKKEKDEFWVTYLGRITEQKGPEIFFESARIVLRRYNKAKFIVAGEGDLCEVVKGLVHQHRLADKFIFPGFLSPGEVIDLFDKSDVYVMPSLSEPFGISALEAALKDVPVVVAQNAGVLEVLPNAIPVNVNDPYEIADRIDWLISEPWYADGIRKANVEALKKLSWNDVSEKLLNVYKTVVTHEVKNKATKQKNGVVEETQPEQESISGKKSSHPKK